MTFKDWIPSRLRKDKLIIPVVRLAGVIAPAGNAFRPALSLATVASPLQRAFEVKAAPVVALSVNSPGGSPVQSRLIFNRIRELAEKHKKRVLVFVEDVAASGGYMIALAGDEIIADETSVVGSIGVVSAGFGFDQAIEKLGIARRVYTAGKNKVLLDPFRPEKESDVEHLKSLQADIHKIFIDMVKQARGAKLGEGDEDIFSGLFWTGAKAQELGLVDENGLMESVLRQRYGDKVQMKLFGMKRGLFGRVQPGILRLSDTGPQNRLGQDLAAGLPGALLDALETRAAWQRYGL